MCINEVHIVARNRGRYEMYMPSITCPVPLIHVKRAFSADSLLFVHLFVYVRINNTSVLPPKRYNKISVVSHRERRTREIHLRC